MANSAKDRLVDISLDASIGRATPDIEHERAIAIFDLIEENSFELVGHDTGPYKLILSLVESRLVFDILNEGDENLITHILSLTPFRQIVKDYFMICESYYEAIKSAATNRIEALDMGRRGIHNEGAQILKDRLDGKINIDTDTSRRLFTLVCVLHWQG
ncbi:MULTISPECIES: UPF0262 family protein [unclassified Lentilitoribacter]|jgi:uncharacterized protein (UPF0262 family)|uniref:UPF0262 family protein n=1 Tax=unclassified Lentilitoribacter TaxID=2647570 RepID=UPI0013A7008C|nr:UPF0262 family protein [Lentilitoribacter sp. Alg239-R112]